MKKENTDKKEKKRKLESEVIGYLTIRTTLKKYFISLLTLLLTLLLLLLLYFIQKKIHIAIIFLLMNF